MIPEHFLCVILEVILRRDGSVRSYPEEGEVSGAIDAGDLQVTHHHLTVLIILP